MTVLHVDIDAHGRVAPGSDEARRALADRAGRFLLAPSSADLLVARRTPPAGGPSGRPRLVLAGDLEGFPIGDFLAFVHHSRLSGALTVAAGGVERTVVFRDGEVRAARSSAAGERIGEVAVRLGFASEAAVAGALGAGDGTGRSLVERGVVAEKDLWKCLHEQATAVFHAVLLSASGTFFLVDEDPGDRQATPLAVSTQSLLMDGIRRIDEMSLFRARIPGPDAALRRRDSSRPVTLRPTENALLVLVDGRRTVAEVATAAHLSEFDATKVLFHLAEAGYVEAVQAPRAGPAERIAAVLPAMNGLLREVTRAVPPAGRAPFLEAARAFLADRESPFAPLLSGLAPSPDGGLDERALRARLDSLDEDALARLEPSGDRSRALLEALREALFFWLFLAAGRIPREADEAIGAKVKAELARIEGLP